MVAVSNPPSLVPSGSISDLSGLSRAASQNYQSRSSSCSLTPPSPDEHETDIIAKSKPEVSQVEKRIRVMMWLSSCKPTQAQFSTPVKGWPLPPLLLEKTTLACPYLWPSNYSYILPFFILTHTHAPMQTYTHNFTDTQPTKSTTLIYIIRFHTLMILWATRTRSNKFVHLPIN